MATLRAAESMRSEKYITGDVDFQKEECYWEGQGQKIIIKTRFKGIRKDSVSLKETIFTQLSIYLTGLLIQVSLHLNSFPVQAVVVFTTADVLWNFVSASIVGKPTCLWKTVPFTKS